MKKIISFLLVICMMVSMTVMSLPQTYAATTHGYMLGDADDDGRLTMKDVLLTRKFSASVAAKKDISIKSADVDGSGVINMQDILLLRKAIAGIVKLDGVNEDGRFKIGKLSIGGKNISRFSVTVPENATACMRNAARILSNYINSACGYALSVKNESDAADDYKIRFTFDKDNENDLGLEGYRVFVNEAGDLEVVCGSLRGPIYAAYYILEELIGYRFFLDNDQYLYENDAVNVDPNFDATEVPGYSYRALSQGGCGEHAIQLRLNDSSQAQNAENGWRVGSLYIHAHSYAYQMAGYEHTYDADYVKPFHSTQPCLVKEETYDKIVEYNFKLLAERARGGQHLGEVYTQISCSPNDNTAFCQCEQCKEIYRIEGSIAGTVFRLANRVIATMREVYPEIELYTIAYWDARNPPKYTRPDDAICVCFCIGGCNNHTFDRTDECVENDGNPRLQSPSGENSNNDEDIRFLTGWAELTNNLQIWYYSTNFTYYMAPSANVLNIYNDFKYLYDIGASGMYNEGSETGFTFERLKGYLAAKMMWNPGMSVEEFNDLLNEYLMFYYGPGWRYVREYLDMTHEGGDLQGCWTNNFDRPWNLHNEEYYKENYHHMVELFDKAIEMAETSLEIRHLNECRLSSDFLGLSATYESDYVNGDEESRAFYKERYKFLYEYTVNHENDGIRVAGLKLENFPKSADDIYDPMTWIMSDFTGRWEWSGDRWV